ncbi:histidine triad (HIT) family protein [Melghirimyces thermohalophilus]|uniref:Histidine triad (HIT) family protein n=1 Tax=Melghirimyces thermohalophilus TaxID=1236220 RepID=A0A1G6P3M5_9BACL|nr:histidine triad nucleotide-binding protein [Melghirimyces thermohalophilus]SDC74204.1 histidine triad (HIT) family protein [Melghirimyces thermohalophilus]
MADCIFCKIVEGSMPSEKVYEDDAVLAFKDIHAQAPVHLLVIPKRHIPSVREIGEEEGALMGRIFAVINQLAKEHGLADRGFRIVNNCGEEGGQTVHHIHFHLLGGRALTWPPG